LRRRERVIVFLGDFECLNERRELTEGEVAGMCCGGVIWKWTLFILLHFAADPEPGGDDAVCVLAESVRCDVRSVMTL